MSVFLQRLGLLYPVSGLPGLDIPFANIVLQVQNGADLSTTFVDQSTGYGTHVMSQSGEVKHSGNQIPPLTDDFSSIDFPGTGFFQAADHIDFDLPGNYGMDMWIRTSVGGYLMTKYNFNSQRAFLFIISVATGVIQMIQYGVRTNASSNVNSVGGTTDLRDGEWHHVCATHEADSDQTMHVFVDGLLEGSKTDDWGGSWPIDATTAPIKFGRSDNDVEPYTGQMAWPRIWRDHTGPIEDFAKPTTMPGDSFPPPGPVVRVNEFSIYTILGASQVEVSAQMLEVYTIEGASQTAVSLQSLEVYGIVGAPAGAVSLQSLEVYAIVEV